MPLNCNAKVCPLDRAAGVAQSFGVAKSEQHARNARNEVQDNSGVVMGLRQDRQQAML